MLDYIPEIPAALDSASHAKRADWIRLELLRRYGGIWVDASSIPTRSLDWVLTQYIRTPAEFMGFTWSAIPVMLLTRRWKTGSAAPPGSRLIVDWQHEFTTEVIHRSGQEYIDHLKDKGVFETVRQHIDSPDYLSMHLALQYILQPWWLSVGPLLVQRMGLSPACAGSLGRRRLLRLLFPESPAICPL